MKEEDDSQYILLDAQDNLNQNNFERCIELCQTVLDNDPNNEVANILSAIGFHKLKQHQKAIELFEKFPDKTKSQSATWRWYALALFQAEENDKAEIIFEQLAEAYPEDGEVCYSFGYFRLFQKQYDHAIELFNKSLATSTIEMNLVYFNRGIAHYNLKDYNAALADMEQTIELEPEHAEAAAIIAEIYKIKGDFEKALEFYSRSLYYEPNNRKLRFSRLIYLINLKEEDGNIINHEMAQQDADKLTPYMHEFITLTSKEGLPLIPIKIKISETGSMDFEC